jgi:hypothetical protein
VRLRKISDLSFAVSELGLGQSLAYSFRKRVSTVAVMKHGLSSLVIVGTNVYFAGVIVDQCLKTLFLVTVAETCERFKLLFKVQYP